MNIKHLISRYLKESFAIQIATSVNNIPWVCTVCFAFDKEFCIYWFSRHHTRHSQEIALNPHVAAAVSVPYVVGDKSRGLQIDGIAEELSDETEITLALAVMKERYHVSAERVTQLKQQLFSGSSDFGLYVLRPTSIILHDTLNFPTSPRQIFRIQKITSKK